MFIAKKIRSLFLWTISKRDKKRQQRRRRPPIQLQVEALETRVVPVVGADIPAAIVPPGTNLDGVVMLQNTAGAASGEELADQTEVLTARHVVPVPGPATMVTWNLQRNGIPVNIAIPIPVNAGGAMANNYVYPSAASFPTNGDIALVNLRDSLPLPPIPSANNLRLVAPFSPFENGYPIMAPGPLNPNFGTPAYFSQTVSIVGYGRQGFAGLVAIPTHGLSR